MTDEILPDEAPSSGSVRYATHEQLEALRVEVAALRELVIHQPEAAPSPPATEPPGPEGQGQTFWALEGLRARLADHPAGGVLLTGSVHLEGDVPYAWQQGATTDSLLASDWSELAPTLDALGHPVRLQLLQLVANGVHRTADLADAEGLGTSGQLHHHLRQLVATGWLRSAGRGAYEIPAARVVPLLVVLTATQR